MTSSKNGARSKALALRPPYDWRDVAILLDARTEVLLGLATTDVRVLDERGLASGYLFPSPITPARPITNDLARDWLCQAERLAELESQQGSAWHAYRRGWATARKHLPLADLAAAGGWKGTEALQRCYLHADDATMLAVVMSGAELREKKA